MFRRDFLSGAAALAAAAVVAAMQVPRLNHYPSDVGAGILLGTASEAAASLVMNIGLRRKRSERFKPGR